MIRTAFQEAYASILEDFGLSDIPREYICLMDFHKKEYICQEEIPITHLMIVAEGRTKVVTYMENGRSLMHSFTAKNTLLGEIEFLTGQKGAAMYVQAVTPVRCIGISIKQAAPSLRSNVKFMNRMSVFLAKKLLSSNYNTARMVLYSLESRLCSYIELASTNSLFEEQLTQVSELLGTSYRHLLRTMEKLCREKLLQKTGHGYLILNPVELHNRGRGFYSLS